MKGKVRVEELERRGLVRTGVKTSGGSRGGDPIGCLERTSIGVGSGWLILQSPCERLGWLGRRPACGCAEASKDQGSSQEASDDASQHSHLPLSSQQLQAASSTAAETSQLGGDRDQHLSMLDAMLRNQEALQKILMNQDTLKGLVDRLMKAVTSIEERVHTIEREMGLLSRFMEELNTVDTETNWG
uniref:Uncharacterized protein n=1 Tax=Sphaerodactylus townsendi TaxID=933632 RepID=A0ACB8EFT2_9SAUR